MHFSGKGAGASMMLSSSMGAMGVAVGIAIDAGIAKDIGKVASESNFDIEAIVADVFEDQASKNIEVTIARYGFLTAPSSDGISDPVVPQLHLLIKDRLGSSASAVRIPEGLTDPNGCTLTRRGKRSTIPILQLNVPRQ